MFGIDDAIIGSAVIGAGASLFGAHKSASSAEAVNAAQLAFARESAQNKYQWAVKDMEKAGLNPKLAGTQNASVTGAQVPNLKNPGDAFVSDYGRQLLDNDFLVIDNQQFNLPRYYDKKLALQDESRCANIRSERVRKALAVPRDAPNRLAQRELYRTLKSKLLERGYESGTDYH